MVASPLVLDLVMSLKHLCHSTDMGCALNVREEEATASEYKEEG